MKKKIVLGISGINAVDNPGPGIGVARSLKESSNLDVTLVGLAYDAMEPGIYMDFVIDKTFLMPYPSGDSQAYMDRLLYIKNSFGLDYIIPNLDVELPFYIKYARALSDWGIETFLPDMAQFRLRGKDRLKEIGETLGVLVPQTIAVNSYDQLAAAMEKIGGPVMVKGIFYKAYLAHTFHEAAAHYNAIVAEWGYPVLVQEVVRGEELNVIGLGDGLGESLGLVGIKKLSVTHLGKIWTGVTIHHSSMMEAAEEFIRRYSWRGPFELECMVNDKDVYLIEINPRFPAWLYFATGVGINLPERLVRFGLGMTTDRESSYEAGRLFIRYSYEMVTDMDRFQQIVTQGETTASNITRFPVEVN